MKIIPIEQRVYIVRGERPPLTVGRGWAIYEKVKGEEVFVTVISGYRLGLHAVTDEQYDMWCKKDLIAYPVMIEP